MKEQKNSPKITRLLKPSNAVVATVGILLIVFGGYGIFQRYKSLIRYSSPPNSNEAITNSTKKPSESKPKNNDDYNVAPTQPKRIVLKSIQTSGFIQKVGIDQDAKIAVPTNIHYAGWFVNSVLPGDEGLSIIDGHVSGKYSDGIFKELGKMKKGERFQVEFGNNSIKNFEVADNRQIPESEAFKLLYNQDRDIKNQLNLITCGGKFNKDTQKYDDRIIVISRLLE